MKTQHPAPSVALPISHEIYQQLAVASCHTGFEKEDWEIAAIAIREWMTRNNPVRSSLLRLRDISGSIFFRLPGHYSGLLSMARIIIAWLSRTTSSTTEKRAHRADSQTLPVESTAMHGQLFGYSSRMPIHGSLRLT
ncbi:MAG: hypothetical protein V4508_05700 [Pseudomonadota bacterium]